MAMPLFDEVNNLRVYKYSCETKVFFDKTSSRRNVFTGINPVKERLF